nr:immunoglobulin heavy chain junction region [Mus musculus]
CARFARYDGYFFDYW